MSASSLTLHNVIKTVPNTHKTHYYTPPPPKKRIKPIKRKHADIQQLTGSQRWPGPAGGGLNPGSALAAVPGCDRFLFHSSASTCVFFDSCRYRVASLLCEECSSLPGRHPEAAAVRGSHADAPLPARSERQPQVCTDVVQLPCNCDWRSLQRTWDVCVWQHEAMATK